MIVDWRRVREVVTAIEAASDAWITESEARACGDGDYIYRAESIVARMLNLRNELAAQFVGHAQRTDTHDFKNDLRPF